MSTSIEAAEPFLAIEPPCTFAGDERLPNYGSTAQLHKAHQTRIEFPKKKGDRKLDNTHAQQMEDKLGPQKPKSLQDSPSH